MQAMEMREYVRMNGQTAHCRVCDMCFDPDSKRDAKQHAERHEAAAAGGFPYALREFLKDAGHAAIHQRRASIGLGQEEAKQAIAYAWWARAVGNGIDMAEFDDYMEAHLAYLDADEAGDEQKKEKAAERIKLWRNYA